MDLEVLGSGFRSVPIQISASNTRPPSGPWSLADETTYAKGSQIGSSVLIRHLVPATQYFARVDAKSELGTSNASIEFTTRPVIAPEITELGLARHNRTVSKSAPPTPTLAAIETNGAKTEYQFEYATSEQAVKEGKGTPAAGASGSHAPPLKTSPNPKSLSKDWPPKRHTSFVVSRPTGPGNRPRRLYPSRPSAPVRPCSSTMAATLRSETPRPRRLAFLASSKTRSFETHWRYESATSASGPWTPVPGASGTISAGEASELVTDLTGSISGLSPATVYYVRLFVENGHGEVTSAPRDFETAGPPQVSTFPTHTFAAGSETIRVLGSVRPDTAAVDEIQTVTVEGAPTGGVFTLTFEGDTTTAIPVDASRGAVRDALAALPSVGGGESVRVEGNPGGPYEVEFRDAKGGIDLPQIAADASGLTPSGSIVVATLENGFSFDTHYHFEYVSQTQLNSRGSRADGRTRKALPQSTSAPAIPPPPMILNTASSAPPLLVSTFPACSQAPLTTTASLRPTRPPATRSSTAPNRP